MITQEVFEKVKAEFDKSSLSALVSRRINKREGWEVGVHTPDSVKLSKFNPPAPSTVRIKLRHAVKFADMESAQTYHTALSDMLWKIRKETQDA